eukprot:7242835-Pyramimonas_sp.AAC.1
MDGGPDKSELSVGAMDAGSFAEYLSVFLQTKSSREEKRGVFLTRNLRGGGGEEEEDALLEVCVYNGLECKISCNTSKVSYVLDTEDLFHRRKRGAKAKATVPCCLSFSLPYVYGSRHRVTTCARAARACGDRRRLFRRLVVCGAARKLPCPLGRVVSVTKWAAGSLGNPATGQRVGARPATGADVCLFALGDAVLGQRLASNGGPTPKEQVSVERFHALLEKHAAAKPEEAS